MSRTNIVYDSLNQISAQMQKNWMLVWKNDGIIEYWYGNKLDLFLGCCWNSEVSATYQNHIDFGDNSKKKLDFLENISNGMKGCISLKYSWVYRIWLHLYRTWTHKSRQQSIAGKALVGFPQVPPYFVANAKIEK